MAIRPLQQEALEGIRNPAQGLSSIGSAFLAGQKAKQDKLNAELNRKVLNQRMDDAEIDRQLMYNQALGDIYGAAAQLYGQEGVNPMAVQSAIQQMANGLPTPIAAQFKPPANYREAVIGLGRTGNFLDYFTKMKEGALEAPPHRSVRDGKYIVNQEWDSKSGKYIEVGRGLHSGAFGSEFERLMNKKQTEGLNEIEEKRLGVLAGTEMRKGAEVRESRLDTQFEIKETNQLHDEYLKGSEHARTISNNIDAAIAAMDTGDTELSDKLLAQVLSQVQDTDVRAFQMYGEFNKPFGNLAERITGQVSRFFKGSRTQEERAVIRKTLEHFKNNYSERVKTDLRNIYRNTARNKGYDPFQVVPPVSPEDIRDYPGVDTDEKLRLLKVYFPQSF